MTYTVTYKPGANGSGSQTTDTKTKDVALTLKGATFTRTGYTQTGWATADGGSKAYNLGASYTANAALTLYPYWTVNTYSVSYSLNGGTAGSSKPTSATFGTAFKVSAPAKSGYTFAGWTVSGGLNSNTAKYGTSSSSQTTSITSTSQQCANGATGDVWFLNLSSSASGSVTLTANWTPAAATTYIVTYKPGANGSGSQTTDTKTQNVTLTLKGAIFTRTGYTQTGWSTSDGGSKSYNLGASYTANAAITLYPYWICNHASTTVRNARAATCTESGYTGDTVCNMCGATIATGSAIPALGHQEGAGVVTKEPTTTEEGVMTYSCTRCGIVMRTETIPRVTPIEEIAVPTVHINGGSAIVTAGEFSGGSCEVSLFCATEGAVIYYTTNGTSPRMTDRYRYTGPFTITDTVTIKAIAVLGEEKSEYATVTISRRALALGEAASADAISASLQWTTGGDAEWVPIIDETSSTGFSAQSGAIGDATGAELSRTWIQTDVTGKGTVSFRWKVECEWDDSGDATWDRVMFFTNGVEVARMDGASEWEEQSFTFVDSGVHTLRWEFVKDDYNDEEFRDRAWVSGFMWMSGVVDMGIRTLPSDATAEDVREAVDSYGFFDTNVSLIIGGDVQVFNDFALWSQSVVGGKDAIVASEYAAVSYLLRAEKAFTEEPTIEISEMAEAGSDGLLALTVSVKDGDDVVAVSSEKVAEMFEATDDLKNWIGGSLKPIVVDVTKGKSGLMYFNVGLGEDRPQSAFIRLKVKAKISTVSPPSNMEVSRASADGLSLQWNVVDGASAYEVWRAKDEPVIANARLIAVVDNGTSYDDVNVDVGTMYYYWLRTLTGIGYSDFGDYVQGYVVPKTYIISYKPGSNGTGSQQTETKTQGISLTLKGVIFTRTGYTQTGWSTTDGGSKAYNLGASYTSNAALTLYPYWTANTYSVSYALNSGTAGASAPTSATYDTAFKVSAPSRSGYAFAGWTVKSGLNASTAKYGAIATNQTTSITSMSQTCLNGATGDVWFKNLTPTSNGSVTLHALWLAAPSSVSATDATLTDGVQVTWSAVENATYYQVWRGTTSSSSSATQIGYNVTDTSYSDTTALVGTNYYYWVKAVCGSVVSSFSGSDVGRRMIAAPSGVTVATDSTGTNLVVSWSGAVSGAAKYEIWRATYTQTSGGSVTTSASLSRIATVDAIVPASGGGTSSSGLHVIHTPAHPRTSYTDHPNLSGNKFYRYRVKAVGGSNTSAASNYSEIRTYKNAGTYSLSLPSTANYSIAAVGGGGGGAQCAHSSLIGFNIAGGGSGAYYKGVLNLAKGSYKVNVGGAGAASVQNYSTWADAGNGGQTKLAYSTGSSYLISAGGGGGGSVSGTSATGGSGGAVSIGSSTTVVSTSSNVSGKVGGAKRQVASGSANGGASVYGGYGAGGNNSSNGGVGFFQIVINGQ